MRARTCLLLLTAGVITLSTGPGFGRPMIRQSDPHLSWGETYGTAGPLESLEFDYKPTVCATWNSPAYPVLHPMPQNANGTPADCSRPGIYASADKDISVKDLMTGAALADSTLLFEDYDVDLDEEITTLKLEAEADVYSIDPGCTPCMFGVFSDASYYAENIDWAIISLTPHETKSRVLTIETGGSSWTFSQPLISAMTKRPANS